MKRLIEHKKLIPIIFIFILGLVPLLWFFNKGNILINGVDTNFPLNPLIWFVRRFYVWSSVPNLGTDYSYAVAGLFFHLIQAIPYFLGFSLHSVELLSLIFWFLAIVFGAYVFIKSIAPKHFLTQVAFVVFYSFNTYIFNTWENVKVTNLSLVAGIPILLAVYNFMNQKKLSVPLGVFLSVVSGILISGSGINPSYFAVIFLALLIYIILDSAFSPNLRIIKLRNAAIVIFSVVLVNLFWILPTFNYVTKSISGLGSIGSIGFNDWTDSLSENTSLYNVMRLQGAWDWYSLDLASGLPLYIPYALNYFYRLPFIIFSLIIPGLALLSLIFRNKGRNSLYVIFSLMAVLGIFLGAGTHPPTGPIFRFLLNHVPFFSLFRSPWYIFTPILILAYAGLIGLLVDRLLSYQGKYKKISTISISIAVLALILSNLVYCYPLLTGKIFRPGRLDGFYINFPKYVFDAGDWLSKDGFPGRILGYPDNEIEEFSWGYRGIDSILELVASRDVIFSPLNNTNSATSLIIKKIYSKIKKSEIDSFLSLAERLNIGTVFEKNDQSTLSPNLPEKITNLESKIFDKWSFYNLSKNGNKPKVSAVSNLSYVDKESMMPDILGSLGPSYHFVYSKDNVVNGFSSKYKIDGRAISATNMQVESFQSFGSSDSRLADRLTSRDVSKALFSFDVSEEGFYQPILERYKLETFGINVNGNISALIDNIHVSLIPESSNDSNVIYKPLFLSLGHHVLSFDLVNSNLIKNGDFNSENVPTKEGYNEGSFSAEIIAESENKFVSLTNIGKAGAAAVLKVENFDPLTPYYIEFKYRQIYGSSASVVVEQVTPTMSIKTDKKVPPNYPVWVTYGFYFEPVQTNSGVNLLLEPLPTSDPLGTKVYYDDISVRKVFTNSLVFLKLPENLLNTPRVEIKKGNPVRYVGEIRGVSGPHVIAFSENYSPDWLMKVEDEGGKSINVLPKHFTLDSYANGWFLNDTPADYNFEIYYKPQKLFNLGIVILVSTIILSGSFVIWSRRRHENK